MVVLNTLSAAFGTKTWRYARKYDWSELERFIEDDCREVRAADFRPDLIVGIKSGGAVHRQLRRPPSRRRQRPLRPRRARFADFRQHLLGVYLQVLSSAEIDVVVRRRVRRVKSAVGRRSNADRKVALDRATVDREPRREGSPHLLHVYAKIPTRLWSPIGNHAQFALGRRSVKRFVAVRSSSHGRRGEIDRHRPAGELLRVGRRRVDVERPAFDRSPCAPVCRTARGRGPTFCRSSLRARSAAAAWRRWQPRRRAGGCRTSRGNRRRVPDSPATRFAPGFCGSHHRG